MTTQEAAKRLGMSVGYIQRLISAGKLKAKLTGRVWAIDAASVLKYAAQDRRPGPKARAKNGR